MPRGARGRTEGRARRPVTRSSRSSRSSNGAREGRRGRGRAPGARRPRPAAKRRHQAAAPPIPVPKVSMTTGSKPRPAPVQHSPRSAMSASFSSTTGHPNVSRKGLTMSPSIQPGKVCGLWIVPRTGSTGPAHPMPMPMRSRADQPVSVTSARHRLRDPSRRRTRSLAPSRWEWWLREGSLRCRSRSRPRSSFRRCRSPLPGPRVSSLPPRPRGARVAVAEDGHVGVQPQEGRRTTRRHRAR